MRHLAQSLLKFLGWTLVFPPDAPNKSVICIAPHTSTADFFVGKLYYMAVGRTSHFMMKKEFFVFPLGWLLRKMGGVPIDRSRRGSMVNSIVDAFARKKKMSIAITPEGTRRAVRQWKTGFYRIALGAGVPIQLAMLDFGNKRVGIFETFYPTGNEEEDIRYIRSKYSKEQAKYPDKFIEYKEV